MSFDQDKRRGIGCAGCIIRIRRKDPGRDAVGRDVRLLRHERLLWFRRGEGGDRRDRPCGRHVGDGGPDRVAGHLLLRLSVQGLRPHPERHRAHGRHRPHPRQGHEGAAAPHARVQGRHRPPRRVDDRGPRAHARPRHTGTREVVRLHGRAQRLLRAHRRTHEMRGVLSRQRT